MKRCFSWMKKQRRLLDALLGVVALAVLLSVAVSAQMSFGFPNAHSAWSFDHASGVLHIYGSGDIEVPTWSVYRDSIVRVVVDDGIVSLPDEAFRSYPHLTTVLLPDSLQSLGRYAFAGCTSLRDMTLPGALQSLGEGCFAFCDAVRRVSYTGTTGQWRSFCSIVRADTKNAAIDAITPEYSAPLCRVDVFYLYADSGQAVAQSSTYFLTLGESASFDVPQIVGYTPNVSSIQLTNVCEPTVVTVYYRATMCHVTVHCQTQDGVPLCENQLYSLPHGAAFECQAPEIFGYRPLQSKIHIASVNEREMEYTVVYVPLTFSITVHCVNEQGVDICDSFCVGDVPYGGNYSVSLPYVTGYRPLQSTLTGGPITGALTLTAQYEPEQLQIRVRCVDEQGNYLRPDAYYTVAYGRPFAWQPEVIEGYTPTESEVSLAAVYQHETLTAVYVKNRYTLTVQCRDEQGNVLHEQQLSLLGGEAYSYTPPRLSGYVRSGEGDVSGVMPYEAVVLPLYYTAERLPVQGSGSDDGASDEGQGNDGGSVTVDRGKQQSGSGAVLIIGCVLIACSLLLFAYSFLRLRGQTVRRRR